MNHPAHSSVDIIVNVYNEEKNVEPFVRSLLEQTHSAFRLLIVDDGSTDDTVVAFRKYESALNLEIIELTHVGLRGARAKAVDAVQADIFIIFDADQIIESHTVERLIKSFADPKVGAVTGYKISQGNSWSERGQRVIAQAAFSAINGTEGQADQLSGGCFACRTEAIRQLGGFASHDKYAEDAEISWRLQKYGWKTIARPDVFVYHQDPIGAWEMVKWGWRMGWLGVHTRLAYPEKFFKPHLLIRFGPLLILAIAFFWPMLAIVGLLGSFPMFLLQVRATTKPLLDKFYAWLVFLLKSLGWSVAFIRVLIEYIFNRIRGINDVSLPDPKILT